MPERFHFHRFEFKYLIDNRYKEELINNLLQYMNYDVPSKNGRFHYEVLNLYLDSPDLKFYRQKMDGLMFRKKLRFRFYTFDPEQSDYIFLEIKRKKNMTFVKDRIRLSYANGIKVLRRDFSSLLQEMNQLAKQQAELLSEFIYEIMRNRLESKLWVRYKRIPLLAKANKLRVTIDDNPVAVVAKNGFNFDPRRPHHCLFRSKSVIEIKYNGSLPFWLHNIIQSYQLFREPISKYCNAIEKVVL